MEQILLEKITARSRGLTDKSDLHKRMCLEAFKHYKKVRKMPDPHNSGICYDVLWNKGNGLITYSKEERHKIAGEVEQEYLKTFTDVPHASYEWVITNLDKNRTLYNLIRQAILKKYFDELISQNKDLTSLLSNLKQ